VRLDWPDSGWAVLTGRRNGNGAQDGNGTGLDKNGAPDANGAPDGDGTGPHGNGTGPVANGADRVATPVLRLTRRPEPMRRWLGSLWRHRGVLLELSKKDFRVRYKRASLGALWAGAVPVLQAAVMAFVFSRVGKFGSGNYSYAVYVLAGMAAWAYASMAITASTTSIVEAATLTDKVWFPRAVLALVPVLSNLVALAISVVVVVVAVPLFGEPITPRLLLLVPAAALVVAFSAALGLVLSALDVYFRDVKFMVQAAVLVWFYVTPIIYPPTVLGGAHRWLAFNPMTGIVGLFQRAAVGAPVPSATALIASVAATLVLLVVGMAIHRRHDRLFVDQL
jgi:lipopolysaccharide transport system permease protein